MLIKRIIALVLTFAMLMSVAVFAESSASAGLSVAVGADDNRKITISGTATQYPGTTVTVLVLFPEKSVDSVQSATDLTNITALTYETKVKADYTYEVKFYLKGGTGYVESEHAPSGRYTVKVYIPGNPAPLTETFDYRNLDYVNAVVNATKSGAEASIKTALDSYIHAVSVEAGVRYNSYTAASQKTFVAKHLAAAKTDIQAKADAAVAEHQTANPSADQAALDAVALTAWETEIAKELMIATEKIDKTIEMNTTVREDVKALIDEDMSSVIPAVASISLMSSVAEATSKWFGIKKSTYEAYDSLSDGDEAQAIILMTEVAEETGFTLPDDVRLAFEHAVTQASDPNDPGEFPGDTGTSDGPGTQGGSGGSGGSGGGSSTSVGSVATPLLPDKSDSPETALIGTDSFGDIAAVPWAKAAINTLAASGVINGRSENEFCPNATITREEFLKLIITGLGIQTISEKNLPFEDVKFGEWYYDTVSTAFISGIVSGVSSTSFGVGENITRQDAAKMFENALKYLKYELSDSADAEKAMVFKDSDKIADYAKSAVEKMSAAKIINGYENGEFAPNATATRAEAAVMLYRILYKLNKI